MDINDYWLRRLSTLKVDAASGDPAPHKRLLLLCVLDLAEEGQIQQEILPLNGELAFRFCTYWTVVAARRKQRPDVRLPFHHLKSGGFWLVLTSEGKPSPDKKQTAYAKLDSSFLRSLTNPAFRANSRRLLVNKGFTPAEQIALCAMLAMSVPSEAQIAQASEAVARAEATEQGREARFRMTVIPAYNYTCALTNYRLITVSSGSIVDAAHIHRFADSRNNDPRNGIALCKNAHWLFDLGLWTLTDDYRVRVASGAFSEAGETTMLLKSMEGRKVVLPSNPDFWPNPVHLAWHRANRFQGVG